MIQLRYSRTEYVSATNLNICQFVAIRGIRALCGIYKTVLFAHTFTWNWQEPFLNQRKVAKEDISVLMINLQEIMDFGWVAMELTNPWCTAGLASGWGTGPNKIILSYEY